MAKKGKAKGKGKKGKAPPPVEIIIEQAPPEETEVKPVVDLLTGSVRVRIKVEDVPPPPPPYGGPPPPTLHDLRLQEERLRLHPPPPPLPPPPPPPIIDFGPIGYEFGFAWRSFALVFDGQLSVGLEKIGADPHLPYSDAKRLDPTVDEFLWQLNHATKHVIRKRMKSWILDNPERAPLVTHLTSQGFIWRIFLDFEDEFEEIVRLERIGVDPKKDCSCLADKAAKEAAAAAEAAATAAAEAALVTSRLTPRATPIQSLASVATSEKKGRATMFVPVLKPQGISFACCYCGNEIGEDGAETPKITMASVSPIPSIDEPPPSLPPCPSCALPPQSHLLSPSPSRTLAHPLPPSPLPPPPPLSEEEKPPRDFLVDPLDSVDFEVNFRRFPPPKCVVTEPYLYAVKRVKGVKFPTVIKRQPKEGIAFYDIKKKEIIESPKVIWVRRPDPPPAPPELSAAATAPGGNKSANRSNCRVPYVEPMRCWGARNICKIECLRRMGKGYRNERNEVEIVVRFGPTEEVVEEVPVEVPVEVIEERVVPWRMPWWWWRRESSLLAEMEKARVEMEERERMMEERRLEEEEAEGQLREMMDPRSRLRCKASERLLLSDIRLVRPWWPKRKIEKTKDVDDERLRRRKAPGMRFDEEGYVEKIFPDEFPLRRGTSDWKAPGAKWHRPLETRPGERRRLSPATDHAWAAFGRQEAQVLRGEATTQGFWNPRERALVESAAFGVAELGKAS